ncbi:MAG TPA: MBOAT family O-acyltransferase [Terracidiphilus sp.]|jgi:D-alanyl-lipoteichoic acid acyltransferase DltB (MBOAT superfamily)
MAFNSYLFLFAFLPLTLIAYYWVALTRLHRLRLPLLIALTIVFYANAALRYLPLLLASIVFNYLVARSIARAESGRQKNILRFGVAANVALLIFYKYAGFIFDNVQTVFGTHAAVPQILLPLAISFYTFQQIAFLVDTSRGLVKPADPVTYASSILFFPYIISGPITLYREIGSQLEERPDSRTAPGNILVGLVIFSLGLFKKTVIADSFALWVDPTFDHLTGGGSIGFLGAWAITAAFLLQMYFDFSGYSDMAIGLARMLGIALPLNFYSPIRCSSIIDWWRRWHMTLGRFVYAYIFHPISVPLMRWAVSKNLGRRSVLIAGTLLPTFTAMLIIGIWHGGNWTFFVFGALHGIYMVINESWRMAMRNKRKGRPVTWLQIARGNILTILAILFALAPFRAADMTTTGRIWKGMVGASGLGNGIDTWPALQPLGGYALFAMVTFGFAFAYMMPNTEQFMTRFEPALEWTKWRGVSPALLRFEWLPSLGWAAAIGAVLLIAIAFVGRGGNTIFVYFGF